MPGTPKPPVTGPVFTRPPGAIQVIVTGPQDVRSSTPGVNIVKGG